MRRFLAAVVALVLLLTGTALATSPEGDTVTVRGKSAVVQVEGPNRLYITVDGQRWTYTRSGNMSGLSGPSGGDTMFVSDVVDEWKRQHPEWEGRSRRTGGFWGQFFIGLVIGGIGLLNLLNPRLSWYLSDGWKFANAEPSEIALVLARVGGFVGIVIGLFVMMSAG